VHFFDADGLSGKDLAEINFFLAQADAATTRWQRAVSREQRPK